MEDKIDAALTCDKGCGHTVDYETCYAHQVQKVKNLLLEAQISILKQLHPKSDRPDHIVWQKDIDATILELQEMLEK